MERADDSIRHSEHDIASAWAANASGATLQTRDGRSVEIVYRGTWTHGFGPDFREAMLLFDGSAYLAGSVELHLVTSGWRAHGHHLDTRYDDVWLHVVATDDGAETRRSDGALVMVAEMPRDWIGAGTEELAWDLVGGEVCAQRLTETDPAQIRRLLCGLGDERLAARVARYEAALQDQTPAQALYCGIWDGLGYAMNRGPMIELANRLPFASVARSLGNCQESGRYWTALSLQLGVGGFLPLSPGDAMIAGLRPAEIEIVERLWADSSAAWHDVAMSPGMWTRTRVRPANHPVARLGAGAALLAASLAGLLTEIVHVVRGRESLIEWLRRQTVRPGGEAIGADRAQAIAASAILPFTIALAEQTDDDDLRDSAMAGWDALPASSGNDVTRRTRRQVAGDARMLPLGGRGEQGLLHLGRTRCAPRRCYECPIAEAVLKQPGPSPVSSIERETSPATSIRSS